ncbi:MAG: DUF4157 domain-containing protein [Desulfobacterales bacterium]
MKPLSGPSSLLIQKQAVEEEEEEDLIQTKMMRGGTAGATRKLRANIRPPNGGGRPLNESERAFFEPRFGCDFNQVRIHTDAQASTAAEAVSARAFTLGDDIVFGAGHYTPNTSTGNRLLAHELTHVIQQRGRQQTLQRLVACEGAEQCPRREHGESQRSQTTPHRVSIYPDREFGMLVSNFAVNDQHVKPDLAVNTSWITFTHHMGSTARGTWEILGFTDCQGTEATNRSLRRGRAVSVAALLPVPTRAASRLRRTDGANLGDCIDRNLSEAGRSRNRSVLIRRLPGSAGPTAPPAPAPIGPVRPRGARGNFCVPYTSRMDAVAARVWLQTAWLTLAQRQFGTDVHNLWRDYLNRPKGSSLAPRVFRGRGHPIVDAFRTDPETVLHRTRLYGDIRATAARTPEANVPFTGGTYTSPPIPLGTLLPAAALNRRINYTDPDERIPGNIAGGTGVMGTSSSDAGPDLRLFTGDVRIVRTRPRPGAAEVRTARIQMQLQVIDAIDFCPGAAGGWLAQRFTIPMSRLEATPTEPTYDLPFHVFVDMSGTVALP